MTGFTFRQRFEVATGNGLPFKEASRVLANKDGLVIELKSLENKPIADSVGLSVWGGSYPSQEAAAIAGAHWRTALQRALAASNIGANFGLRNPNIGGMTDAVLEEMKRVTGVTLLRDSWDVIVFPSEPAPMFSSGTASGHMVPAESVLWRPSTRASRWVAM